MRRHPSTVEIPARVTPASVSTSGTPSRINRTYFELVSDRQRGVVVFVGGELLIRDLPPGGFTAHPVRDTWFWDGKWKAVSDLGPWARTGMSAASDRARSQRVVFGGVTTGLNPADPWVNDTWEWDGALWRQTQDRGPSRRSGAAMAYDVNRNRTVLFDGGGPNEEWDSDTWDYFDYS